MTLTLAEIDSMRGTVGRVSLSMTCTIERQTVTGTDAFGQPVTTWAVLSEDVPCFYWEISETEVQGPRVNAVFTGSQIQFAARTDVIAGDRITGVVAKDGVTVATQVDVTEVRATETDTVVAVRAVR